MTIDRMTITRQPNGSISLETEQTGLLTKFEDDVVREVNWFLKLQKEPGPSGAVSKITAPTIIVNGAVPVSEDERNLRSIALDHAVRSHGGAAGGWQGAGAEDVTNAAAEYLRFLKTGKAKSEGVK